MAARRLLQLVSWSALAATVVPSIAYFRGGLGLDAVKSWMLGATLVWFAVTPLWMGRKASRPTREPGPSGPREPLS